MDYGNKNYENEKDNSRRIELNKGKINPSKESSSCDDQEYNLISLKNKPFFDYHKMNLKFSEDIDDLSKKHPIEIIDPNDFLNRFVQITKLQPLTEFIETPNKKFQCTIKFNEKKLSAVGEDSVKKESKRKATVNLMNEIIKEKLFVEEVNQIIESNNKNVKKLLGNKRKNEISPVNLDESNTKKKFSKSPNISNNHETQDEERFFVNMENKVDLKNFEIFCLFKERTSLFKNEIDINKIYEIITDVLLSDYDQLTFLKIGSFFTDTIRGDHIEYDVLAVYQTENFLPELMKIPFIIRGALKVKYPKNNVIIKNHDNLPSSIEISVENLIMRLIFKNRKEEYVDLIINHQKYILSCGFNLLKLITIKILKIWRRSKGLIFLSTEFLEFLVVESNCLSVGEIVI